MEKTDIHIVGLGNLGTAFINGLSNLKTEINLQLYDESFEVRKLIKENFAINVTDAVPVIEKGVVILCIKPQNIKNYFEKNIEKIGKNILICSPVAGLEIKTIEQYVENSIIRIMPNLLIRENKGFIPYVTNYEGDYLSFITKVLDKLGSVKEFEESIFPIITAISGSGPAWFYELSHQLVNSGYELGLDIEESEIIIKELVKALPGLVSEDETFKNLVDKVKSPNGTTEAGLNSLDNDSFDKIILKAIREASQRSVDISRELENE
tara:strand:+ start:301 stop:1098 length:798 start_codon:yes stop_codon:yes gene_type:complete